MFAELITFRNSFGRWKFFEIGPSLIQIEIFRPICNNAKISRYLIYISLLRIKCWSIWRPES